MKKIMIIILMCASMSVFSLNHGLITGFEVGYNFLGVNQISFDDKAFEDGLVEYNYKNTLSIKLTTGYRFGNLRVIGEYENTLNFKDLDSYMPIQDNFKVEINYTWKNLSIGLYHWCDHPVITVTDKREYFHNAGQRTLYLKFLKEF